MSGIVRHVDAACTCRYLPVLAVLLKQPWGSDGTYSSTTGQRSAADLAFAGNLASLFQTVRGAVAMARILFYCLAMLLCF